MTHELFYPIFSAGEGEVSEQLGGHLAVAQGQPQSHSSK